MAVIDLTAYRARRGVPPSEWAQFQRMCDQYDALREPPKPRKSPFEGWLMVGYFALIVAAILWIVWG